MPSKAAATPGSKGGPGRARPTQSQFLKNFYYYYYIHEIIVIIIINVYAAHTTARANTKINYYCLMLISDHLSTEAK